MEKGIKLFLGLIIVQAVTQNSPQGKANGEKILVLSIFGSKSTKGFYDPLLYELATRGHEITIVSAYKSPKPHKNIRDIQGIEIFDVEGPMKRNMFEDRLTGTIFNPLKMTGSVITVCEYYYEMPEVQALQKEKFDLILATYSMNECGFGLIHHFNVPFILMHVNVPVPWNNPNAVPFPLSFTQVPFFGNTDRLTYMERLKTFVLANVFGTLDDILRVPKMEVVYRKYLGQHIPSAHAIAKNVSLLFSNSHFAINFPRPVMPDLIELGGMHCTQAKPLPKELDDFVTWSGKDGFILFSMGSMLKASAMPEHMRKVLVNTFAKLKQRVIWKWETETMSDLPPNVKLSKWLPQQDILGHPNIKLFITHGGLHSIEEAVFHGVPLLGIPMYGDQDANMKVSGTLGFAGTVEFLGMTEDKLLTSINQLLIEPKYMQAVQRLSKLYRDRPRKPLDDAVYWTEYVIKHRGALHLRSPARDLNFFQYHSLDVILFLSLALCSVLYIFYRVCRFLCKLICGSKSIKKSSSQKQKSQEKKIN